MSESGAILLISVPRIVAKLKLRDRLILSSRQKAVVSMSRHVYIPANRIDCAMLHI